MILAAVVALNEESGDPVGSKLLQEALTQISVSSATLRNEMSALTDLGLLMQPHTSAGRLPTAQGIRFYIDNLMELDPLDENEKRSLTKAVRSLDADPYKATQQVARILSELFGLEVVAATPKADNATVVHFKVLQAGLHNLAVVGVTSTGTVSSAMCRIEGNTGEYDLGKMEDILNSCFVFVYAQDIDRVCEEKGFSQSSDVMKPVLDAAKGIIKGATEVQVFSDGLEYLLAYNDLDEYASDIIRLVSDRKQIRRLVEGISGDVRVLVGDELGLENLNMLGFVAAPYKIGGGQKGGVGVLGPIRMDYSYIIPRLHYFCSSIEKNIA